MHFELVVAQQCECFLVTSRVKEIAEHDRESPSFRPLREGAKTRRKARLAFWLRRVPQEIEYLMKLAPPARQAEITDEARGEEMDVNAVEIREADVGERSSNASGLV